MNDKDDLLWEEIPCGWCGTVDAELVVEGPDRLENLPGKFRFVRCKKCGLLRQNPRPQWSSLINYYPEGYVSHGSLAKEQRSIIKQLDIRYGPWKRMRAVERFKRGGKLLEIGAGSGLFLEEAVRSGRWDVTGIEPNKRAAKYIENNLSIPILNGRLIDFTIPPDTYDVIVMWNVLEHLQDPIKELEIIHCLLKKDGLFVASIPNMESLARKVFRDNWIGYDLPRHLYLFPQPLLKEILENIGFSWLGSRCISTSYATLGLSLKFLLESRAMDIRLRNSLLRIYSSLPVRAGLIPFLWFLDNLRRSTIITIFAQKN